jgi:hypothetical protein
MSEAGSDCVGQQVFQQQTEPQSSHSLGLVSNDCSQLGNSELFNSNNKVNYCLPPQSLNLSHTDPKVQQELTAAVVDSGNYYSEMSANLQQNNPAYYYSNALSCSSAFGSQIHNPYGNILQNGGKLTVANMGSLYTTSAEI